VNQRELDRIRFVTQNFAELKGTYLLEMGVFFLVFTLCDLLFGSSRLPYGLGPILTVSLGLTVGSVAGRRMEDFYRTTLGEVEPYRSRARRWLLVLSVIPVLALARISHTCREKGLLPVV